MEVMQVLHMNKGDDENSYAKNSKVQSKIISLGKRINEEAIMKILCSNIPDIMGIADLGCSSGPNSLSVISEITDIIYAKCRELGRPTPELKVPAGLESNARTAMNKGKIYISKSSSLCVLEAYSLQFQKDFSSFLKSRSKEIVPGGCILLSFMGRRSTDPTTDESCYHWELLAQALMSMVSEGLVEEEKVDSFNAPYYGPCVEEMRLEIEKDGSFSVNRLETFEIDWDGGVDDVDTTSGAASRGQRVAKTIRAVVESMLESHFGKDIMDALFRRYGEMVEGYLSKTGTKYTNLVISMVRN
ncbi:probable jasmonic acid carboxyl methyltransferase 2 isoform X2 [Populus nigra]|uniref:probable jasmonic acid carboxyl methyltransferase 2 isoform X2 n=1 Tax=Populus nigra TaxID=3691 RepID=UPI002B272518|nr:probable jasmonic acid carboxyl methyltransferase 2 isoform X2 [Populus nigra]